MRSGEEDYIADDSEGGGKENEWGTLVSFLSEDGDDDGEDRSEGIRGDG